MLTFHDPLWHFTKPPCSSELKKVWVLLLKPALLFALQGFQTWSAPRHEASAAPVPKDPTGENPLAQIKHQLVPLGLQWKVALGFLASVPL